MTRPFSPRRLRRHRRTATSSPLLATALTALLATPVAAPLAACDDDDDDTSADTASDTASDTDGADGSDADDDASDDANDDDATEARVVTKEVVDETMTYEKFAAMCDAAGGKLEQHAHCGGDNSCKGFSYDATTKVYSEHTCRGLNTCTGLSCVLPDDAPAD